MNDKFLSTTRKTMTEINIMNTNKTKVIVNFNRLDENYD